MLSHEIKTLTILFTSLDCFPRRILISQQMFSQPESHCLMFEDKLKFEFCFVSLINKNIFVKLECCSE